jgi:hypothetical protein
MLVYGNPALTAAFGHVVIGLPAREGILGCPHRRSSFWMPSTVAVPRWPVGSRVTTRSGA